MVRVWRAHTMFLETGESGISKLGRSVFRAVPSILDQRTLSGHTARVQLRRLIVAFGGDECDPRRTVDAGAIIPRRFHLARPTGVGPSSVPVARCSLSYRERVVEAEDALFTGPYCWNEWDASLRLMDFEGVALAAVKAGRLKAMAKKGVGKNRTEVVERCQKFNNARRWE